MSLEPNPYAPPRVTPEDEASGPGGASDAQAVRVGAALDRRALLGLAALLGATFLEALAYYGMTASLPLELDAQRATAASKEVFLALLPAFLFLGMLGGGVAALRFGPRRMAAAGALFVAAGHVALAFGWLGTVGGAALIELGGGVVGPCLLVAGVETLSGDDGDAAARSPQRMAAVAAWVIAQNLVVAAVAAVTPLVVGELVDHFSPGLSHLFQGASPVIAAGLLAVGARRPRRAAPPAVSAPARRARGWAGLALLAGLDAAYMVGTDWTLSREPDGMDRETLVTAMLAALGISAAIFAVHVVAALRRWRSPPLRLHGACLVAGGLATGLISLSGGASATTDAVAVAARSLGMIVVVAVPAAYVAVAARGRWATLVVAGWTAVGLLAGTAGRVLDLVAVGRGPLLWGSILLCLGGGGALLANAPSWHRRYFAGARGA